MLSRRRFLLDSTVLAALSRLVRRTASAQTFIPRFHHKPVPPSPMFVYFATDTEKHISRGIYISRFDSEKGKLTPPQLAAETVQPSFLAISEPLNGKRRIYSTNEGATAAASTLSSFLMDTATGKLTPINQVSSGGAGPCYVSLDATCQSAFVVNYAGSSIATYRVHADGSLSEPVERIDYKDPRFGHRGPNTARQDAPHPHSAHLSPDNRFLLVNDLGSDAISVFAIDTSSSRLGEPKLFTNDRPGSGPRHIAFHPNGRWLYSINELDATIDHFLWSTTSSRTDPQGMLTYTGHYVKTIAPGFPVAENRAAEVVISPDGNFLYASNRGEDSLVVFSIADDGKLKLIQRIACGGKTPRHFTFDPSTRWLICGNQDSATVTIFRRDGATGRLDGPTQTVPIDSVMFALFA